MSFNSLHLPRLRKRHCPQPRRGSALRPWSHSQLALTPHPLHQKSRWLCLLTGSRLRPSLASSASTWSLFIPSSLLPPSRRTLLELPSAHRCPLPVSQPSQAPASLPAPQTLPPTACPLATRTFVCTSLNTPSFPQPIPTFALAAAHSGTLPSGPFSDLLPS